jgi:hypothetical protein
LLVAPVAELGRHYGINVSADLRIAQEFDGIADGLEHVLQVFMGHGSV